MVSAYSDAIPVHQYSSAVFDEIVNMVQVSPCCKLIHVETGVPTRSQFWGPQLYAQDKNATLGITLEPFDYGVFSHGSDSAYPPDRSQAIFPTALDGIWSDPSLDDTMASVLRNISETVHDVALADGQNISSAAKYPNYALFGTPLENMYGGNLHRLHKIRKHVDPEDVMGLTGGWRF